MYKGMARMESNATGAGPVVSTMNPDIRALPVLRRALRKDLAAHATTSVGPPCPCAGQAAPGPRNCWPAKKLGASPMALPAELREPLNDGPWLYTCVVMHAAVSIAVVIVVVAHVDGVAIVTVVANTTISSFLRHRVSPSLSPKCSNIGSTSSLMCLPFPDDCRCTYGPSPCPSVWQSSSSTAAEGVWPYCTDNRKTSCCRS